MHCDVPLAAGEGRFYAAWRRENPTILGTPFTFIEAAGHGHLVGISLQAQGQDSGNTFFFEGDDQATIDGTLSIHGTGSEDFFNGGWYDVPGRWNGRRSFPLSGCLDYQKHLSRSAGYRFMIPDPVVYHQSLLQTIEHAPENNNLVTDYVGMAYLYADRAPAAAGYLPDPTERAVTNPARIAFAAGWQIPIRGFSFQNATLSKQVRKIGETYKRVLSFRAEGSDIFGDHSLEFACEAPSEGRYRVSMEVLAGPACGFVQLSLDDAPAGPSIDLYRSAAEEVCLIHLGELIMQPGANPLCLKLTPSNGSTGIDIAMVFLERVS